ncbi:hypothetical protein D1007_05039 [Hordeum vulgare]|nr:hypothetical protein D1007_05039 [Hordeum vulgare]
MAPPDYGYGYPDSDGEDEESVEEMAPPPDYGYGYPDSDSDGEDEESVEEKGRQWPPAPPAYGYPDGEDERPPYVLIDPCAYFADRDNATTAVCEMDGPSLTGRLKVTFCAVAPPLVSYFCVHATRMDHTEFPVTPYILATETDGGLVLLCVATRDGDHHSDFLRPRNCHYFVYDALSRKLVRLPLPGFQHRLNEPSLAIMRKPSKNTRSIPHPHGHGHGDAEAEAHHFVVAAQSYSFWRGKSPHLCIYDSATKTWSNKPVVMGSSYPELHITGKTLTIGGSNGTVAWVDLWRNIVFCDVLVKRPKLGYLKLPSAPDMEPPFEGRSVRDIAVVGDTIKYVDMLPHPDASPSLHWMATAWSIKKARRSWPKEWHMECKLDSTRIMVDAARTVATFPTSLSSLCVGLPTLSLQNDAIVYFLAKIDFSPSQHTAWVLAVDMENETAEQVVEFPAKRTYCLAKGYDASRISAYLQPAPGTHQTSKRPGVPLLKCPSKKHIKDVEDPEEDDAMVISYS